MKEKNEEIVCVFGQQCSSWSHTSCHFTTSSISIISSIIFHRYSWATVPGYEYVSRSQPRNETKTEEEIFLCNSSHQLSFYFIFIYFLILLLFYFFHRYSRTSVPGYEYVSGSQSGNETENQEEIWIYQQEKTERTPDGKTTGNG